MTTSFERTGLHVGEPLDARTWQLWGKADPARAARSSPEWHPLLCHALDVVACAERLLVDVRPDRLDALALPIQMPHDAAVAWLLLFVALHDLGKATPPFQRKVPTRAAALAALGLDFPNRDEPHGSLSASPATRTLTDRGVPSSLARWVARAVGAHHGEFTALAELSGLEREKGSLLPPYAGKAPLWAVLREHLVAALADACLITDATPRPAVPATPSERNAFIADLAGLTTVADWLGSNADVFAYVDPPPSVAEYLGIARERAVRAIGDAGWRKPPRSSLQTFRALFGKAPWPLHEAVEAIASALDGPSLVLVEAPMGEGKTEAALAIYDVLASRGATGLYFALPTQATSNQIFGRVERFLRSAFPNETHGLHLVHGDAGLSERYGALKERAFAFRSVGGVAGSDQGPIADAWFARSKRALLAPVAVGTLDQALLGVLGVRHGFLRLHGLAGKVVVIDEVHAYDTYTSELLDRLLAWLGALGCTVVLLSATLPAKRREALVAAFGSPPPAHEPYPRITVASSGSSLSRTFVSRRAPVSVTLRWEAPAAIPALLLEALAGGGCAAWIVNTVRGAQRIYRDLVAQKRAGALAPDVEIGLLHARFPFGARDGRERAAEEAFGPGGENRPHAAILIGTQVLEQSLDLDFDLMITELAPVDLVLQRAGRLHRHAREHRPPAFERPALWLVRPEGETSPPGPSFGASAYVYAESILLRSWLALRERTAVTLPNDMEVLIESVYGGGVPDAPDAVARRVRELDRLHEEESRSQGNLARRIVLQPPAAYGPFDDLARLEDDEDPSLHAALRAATRLGDPTVEVVPVVELDGNTVLVGAPNVPLFLDRKEAPPWSVVLETARRAVGISHRRVVAALLKQPVPRAFRASGHLRYHRVLFLDGGGAASIAGVPLRFDPELGLVVGTFDEPEAAGWTAESRS